MKKRKSLFMTAALAAVAMTAFTSCANEDATDSSAPIQFNSSIIPTNAMTRSINSFENSYLAIEESKEKRAEQPQSITRSNTVNSQFTDGDIFAVKIGDVTKKYRSNSTGNLSSDTPFYWQNGVGQYIAKIWFPYSDTYNGLQIQSNQSTFEQYQNSDVLLGQTTINNYISSIIFKHQGVKYVIKCTDDITPSNNCNIKIFGIPSYYDPNNKTWNIITYPQKEETGNLVEINNNGNVYAYNITDKYTTGGAGEQCNWNITIKNQAVNIGDYLFSDGTWGNLTDNSSKTPIAVIFSTSPTSADRGRGWLHGYAVALTSVSGKWSKEAVDEDIVNNSEVRDGYNQTQTIVNNSKLGFSKDNYPLFWNVINYNVTAPKNTSGWYMLSYGQLEDIITNLGKHTTVYFNQDNTGSTETVNNINNYFKVGETIEFGETWYTSSEYYIKDPNYVMVASCQFFDADGMGAGDEFMDRLSIGGGDKTSVIGLTRPVIAF